jgi:photosystem II stability/assembly factor-like uncharacterized protein
MGPPLSFGFFVFFVCFVCFVFSLYRITGTGDKVMAAYTGRIMAGTADGVRLLEARDGQWRVARQGLDNGPVNALLPLGDSVLCGVLGWGVYRTDPTAERFEPASEGITAPQVCALVASPEQPGVAYAGTTPPRLYRTEDVGRSWRELPAFARAPGAAEWVFPVPPGYPNIRWILAGPTDPRVLSVGVEIGGMIRSEDGGETWQDRTADMNRDIHCVAAHPGAPTVLYTSTPQGPYRSDDGGRSWKHLWRDRSPSYSAQIAVHPAQPDTVIAGISRGFRGGDAALYRTTDRGESWTRATESRPSLSETIFKALAFSRSTPEVAAAGTMAGEVWLTEDGGGSWSVAASGLPPVRSLLVE